MEGHLTYLAVPYTSRHPEVEEARYRAVSAVAAAIMGTGEFVFSPITQGHVLAKFGGLPTDWEFWAAYSRAMLSRCQLLAVLMLDGWKESVGVQAEIGIAVELGIPIEYVQPPEFKVIDERLH
jgi:hypothetical protein